MDAPPPPKKRRWLRRFVVLGAGLILLGGLLWCGWYVYNRGFTRKWRELLSAEMRRRGLDFSARRLTLNPFEGLVAEKARVYLLDDQHTQLLYLDRVTVDIDLAAFIQKKPFLNSLDLRGARLTLPVDMAGPGEPRKLKLRHLSAKVAFLPDEVRLTQAEGEFYGVQISASGSLLHPGSFNPPGGGQPVGEPEAERRRQWVRAVIDEIEKIRAERSPPRVEIRFQGDLAQPGSLRASAQLQAEALRRGAYRLDRLLLRADYSAGAFHLQQAELADARGTLAAQGDFNPDGGEARFQLQSSLDLLALGREFVDPKLLAGLVLRDPPRLQLDGRARLGPGPAGGPPPLHPASNDPAPEVLVPPALQLTGRLALGRFGYHAFDFERAETDFSWSGDRWYLRGLHVVRPGGGGNTPQAIDADVLSEPGRARLRMVSTFDPAAFFGLLPAKGQALLARLDFHDLPRVELTASGPSLTDFAKAHVEGQVTLGRTRYRGAGLNRLHMEVAFADGVFTARKLALERDEGSASGDQITYDLVRHEMRLDNVRSGLDLGQVGVWLDPDVYHTIQPFHFHKPPALVMNGTLQFEGGRNSHFVTNVNAPGGMDYVFAKKTLNFANIAGQVVFNEARLQMKDVRGAVFGGEATGGLDLALGRGSAHDYTASLDWKNLDFTRLTKLFFDYEGSSGQLSGSYHFTGRGDDSRTLVGKGAISVEHGNVFAIPFLGPLSPLFSALLPGLGFDEAHQASANFLTHDGKIYTGDMDVKGRGFSLFGAGWLGYTDDTMNFRVRLNTRGLPGFVLSPVSKLFEYSSQGPLSKPVWRPRVLSNPPPLVEKNVGAPGKPPASPPPEPVKPR